MVLALAVAGLPSPAGATPSPAEATPSPAGAMKAARSTSAASASRVPIRSTGNVAPLSTLPGRRAPSLSTVDTITVFHGDFETLVSPGNEGGWTHVDKSGTPTAWHIASTVACQGNAFWAGLIDSSWTGDPDRRGYDNNWVQTLTNFVDLTGATSPRRIGFKHRMNLEPGYDFGRLQVIDPEESDWIDLVFFTGKIPNSGICDTFSVQIPDSIVAKNPVVQFRFLMTTDFDGSSADGLYPAAEGWSVDNVTVRAGASDIRFFDDMEAGMGTWSVSVFPPVGDLWHVTTATNTQQICNSNTSKVWAPMDPVNGNLVPRMDDLLVSPPIAVNGANQVFLGFDAYRNLSFDGCFYYSVGVRSRQVGQPWSNWTDPTGQLYFGTENEWLRQSVTLSSAAGKDSVQVRFEIKDYSAIFCDGQGSAAGSLLYLDNVDIRVLGLAGPSLSTSESSLLNDTFQTTAFFGNDNFNTPRGDSTTVRIGASNGLSLAQFWTSLNGAPFTATPLTPVGAAAPDLYYGDVAAGNYPRGTQLRYYFSATDGLGARVTLPADAEAGAGHYFTATVLPAIFSPTSSCTNDSAPVLYVNAFSGPDGTTGMDQSLAALGIRYDRFDVNAAASALGNSPGGSDPNGTGLLWPAVSAATLASTYSAIIWDVGERSQLTLTPQDQTLLGTWLGTNGKNRGLIVSGDNLAFDLATNGGGTFLTCTLGASFVRDNWETAPQDTLLPTLSGATGTLIASEPFPLNGGCPGLNRFDAIAVSACVGSAGRAWVRYPNTLLGSTERRVALAGTDSARAVLLGFSLASMNNTARRNLFLWRTLVQELETPYCTTPTGVDPVAAAPPADRIEAPRPNPFNPSTSIQFTVGHSGPVRVAVYNVAGARIRLLVNRSLESGEHVVRWDGKDDHGRDVASAAYFIHMDTIEGTQSRKAVLLR